MNIELFDIVFPILVLIAVSGVLFARAAFRRRRSGNIQKQAAKLRFEFFERPDAFPIKLPEVGIFTMGADPEPRNLIRRIGSGCELYILDYKFGSRSFRRHTICKQTVALVISRRQFPRFAMAPELFFLRWAAYAGYQDIDFESHPVFSKNYLLRGKDESQVRELFQPRILSHFEAAKGWTVEGEGPYLVVHRSGKVLSPAALPEMIRETERIAAVFDLPVD